MADTASYPLFAEQGLSVMRAAVFLDRDGVIIENRPDHVKCWSEVRFLAGSLAAMKRLAASRRAIVIVSNQAVVGRGLLDERAAWQLQRQIVAEIAARGGRIDASYLCPHHPQMGCVCRKPAPGMLLQATRDLDLDLSRSWLIGDAWSDLQAARAAGVRGILVRTGRGAEQQDLLPKPGESWLVVADLAAAVEIILGPSGEDAA
jgi:D-glycero-D-manno-heptose 1,7-bisphosphate phosphatase